MYKKCCWVLIRGCFMGEVVMRHWKNGWVASRFAFPFRFTVFRGLKSNGAVPSPRGPVRVPAQEQSWTEPRADLRPRPPRLLQHLGRLFPLAACGTLSLPLLLFVLPPLLFLSLIIKASSMNMATAETKPNWSEAWRRQTALRCQPGRLGGSD